MFFINMSSIYNIKYFYLVILSTIIRIILYICPIIRSFNFNNLTIKAYKITFYSLVTNLINYSFPYYSYFINLFY